VGFRVAETAASATDGGSDLATMAAFVRRLFDVVFPRIHRGRDLLIFGLERERDGATSGGVLDQERAAQ
jgi:hypothetical protein